MADEMQPSPDMQPLGGFDPAAGAAGLAVPPNPSTFAQTAAPGGGCSCGGGCPTCASGQMTSGFQFVYAIGTVVPRFPNLGLEKEVAQSIGRAKPRGLSEEEALIKLLADSDFLYIAREICWVFRIETLDAFVIKVSNDSDLKMLVASFRPDKGPLDFDVVVGRLGPKTSMIECNGVMLPTVRVAQLYSYNRSAFIEKLPCPKDVEEEIFGAAVKQALDVTSRLAGNYGLTDGHRAINYALTRYAAIYELVARLLGEDLTLSGVSARISPLSGNRRIIELVLRFRHRVTDVASHYATRIDVTDVFPFLISPLSPYFEHP